MDSMHTSPPSVIAPRDERSRHGFTLTELMVVMAVIVLLAGLVGPAFQAIKGGNDLTSMAIDIKGVLDQARAQAMAQNTYVYVGIQEVDAATPSANDGIGRVATAMIASLDGTRQTNLSVKVSPVGKARGFDNIHLTNSSSLTNGSTMQGRPGGSLSSIPGTRVISIVDTNSAISFKWPLGTGGKYSFRKVIEFDPQGIARFQTNTTPTTEIQPFIEIALVPSRGNQLIPSLTKNQAAIQIDGVTGRVIVYRP